MIILVFVLVQHMQSVNSSVLAPGDDTNTWFSYRGLPLKWQLPVGVLYDLCVGSGSSVNSKSGGCMPWELTVHHRFFPSAVLVPLQPLGTGKQMRDDQQGSDNESGNTSPSKASPLRKEDVSDAAEDKTGLSFKTHENKDGARIK